MKIRSLLAVLGLLGVSLVSGKAFAVDQLPLPNANVSPETAQVMEFASAETSRTDVVKTANKACDTMLKASAAYNDNSSEKIRAIKAFRQCRADHALQQLAVWRWQENLN